MSDLDSLDRKVQTAKRVAMSVFAIFTALGFFGLLGNGVQVLVMLMLFFGLSGALLFACVLWFYGISLYGFWKKQALNPDRFESYKKKHAEHNLELFSRYIAFYPILQDMFFFNLRLYRTIL